MFLLISYFWVDIKTIIHVKVYHQLYQEEKYDSLGKYKVCLLDDTCSTIVPQWLSIPYFTYCTPHKRLLPKKPLINTLISWSLHSPRLSFRYWRVARPSSWWINCSRERRRMEWLSSVRRVIMQWRRNSMDIVILIMWLWRHNTHLTHIICSAFWSLTMMCIMVKVRSVSSITMPGEFNSSSYYLEMEKIWKWTLTP